MKWALRAARQADLVLVMVDGSASGDAVENNHVQQEMEILNHLLEQENGDDSQSDEDDTMRVFLWMAVKYSWYETSAISWMTRAGGTLLMMTAFWLTAWEESLT